MAQTRSRLERNIAVTAFNPMGLLKSLLPWNRPWAHLRPLIKALRTQPYDLGALKALDDELTGKHREMPMDLLWRIWRLAEKAQTRPGDPEAIRLIDEICRSATWEVQSRYMRGEC